METKFLDVEVQIVHLPLSGEHTDKVINSPSSLYSLSSSSSLKYSASIILLYTVERDDYEWHEPEIHSETSWPTTEKCKSRARFWENVRSSSFGQV